MPPEATTGTTGPLDRSGPQGVFTVIRPGLPSLITLGGGGGENEDVDRPAEERVPPPPTEIVPDAVRPSADMVPMLESDMLEEAPADIPFQGIEDVSSWMTEGGLSYWVVGLALTGVALERARHRSQVDREDEKRKRVHLN